MKAVVITKPGGPEVLEITERERPEPAGDEVLVKVSCAGLNRSDLLQRLGRYPAPEGSPADIPGLEIMGVVEKTGPDVETLKHGDRVFGIIGGGGYAQYAISNEKLLVRVPGTLNDIEAAAVPEIFMTAHDALLQAGFSEGEHVLIHAAGSGVATAAIQLVNAFNGISYGTARSEDKLNKALELGLNYAVPLPDFAAEVMKVTSGRGVDIVLDFVGAPYFKQNLEALAPLGRLVQIGTMGGYKAEINLSLLMTKRIRVTGTVLRSRPMHEKEIVTDKFNKEVIPLLAAGKIRPVIDRIFPMEQAAEAHKYMESNQNFGKILLKIS